MKKIALLFVAALFLAACSTTGTQNSALDVQATVAKVCPTVKATVVAIASSPDILPATKEKLDAARPYVDAVCAAGMPVTEADLYALADKAVPLAIEAVNGSSLSDDHKQAAIVALIVAQVAITTAR